MRGVTVMTLIHKRSLILFIIALLIGAVSHLFFIIFSLLVVCYNIYSIYTDIKELRAKRLEINRIKEIQSKVYQIKGKV